MHAVENQDDIDKILSPGAALELIGFTGHYDSEVHAALLKAYGKWDTVMMPVHAADHACPSFEKTALPVTIEVAWATRQSRFSARRSC